MPKRTATLPLTLAPRETGAALHRWLYDALRAAILAGDLAPGARLPGTRDLAEQYQLSRGTVLSAFDQLKSEGYLEGNVGSGTYVRRVLPDTLLKVTSPRRAQPALRRTRTRRLSGWSERMLPFPNTDPRPTRAFRGNIPALDLFPTALWTKLSARRLRRSSYLQLEGCGPMGYPPLREAVAEYLGTSRGVHCRAEQVAIVSGVQEALDIATRLLVDPGDTVAMEDPGYVGATCVFNTAGARIRPVGLDDQGMRLDTKALRGARLVYVTPAHQFPTGITMSLGRRLALLDWARESGALIFEDDYDSEYRYAGRPIPALQGLDRSGSVLFAGSFSKVLFPSLRLGYLVVPPDMAQLLEGARSITCLHAPLLDQAILADFIAEGHFARHVRRMREIYAQRLSELVHAVHARLDGLLEISAMEAGLQTAAWLPAGWNDFAVTRAARRAGIELNPISFYAKRPLKRNGLQLGFAALEAAVIRNGVDVLAKVLETFDPAASS